MPVVCSGCSFPTVYEEDESYNGWRMIRCPVCEARRERDFLADLVWQLSVAQSTKELIDSAQRVVCEAIDEGIELKGLSTDERNKRRAAE